MEYFRNTTDIRITQDTAITLGKFDGLHTGHQYLLEHLNKRKKDGLKTVIFTFDRPPRNEIEHCEHDVLSTIEEKEYIFSASGIDYLIEFPFNRQVMCMEAEDFIQFLAEKLSMKAVIVGSDFRFGYKRRGDYEMLQKFSEKYGYQVEVVEKKKYMGEDISSTFVRREISEGRIEIANELLGYSYFLQGEILHGNQIGRKIGIPTINLIPPREKKLPPFGVYAALIELDNRTYKGIANVGVKPTVGQKSPAGVETHIFDFNENIYGHEARVRFLHWVRPEKKFDSFEALTTQINEDIQDTKKYFEKVEVQ